MAVANPLPAKEFRWPNGKRAAISLSFDDGRPSQVDNGLPVLNANKVKATFFLKGHPITVERLGGWKQALAMGHEIGNHTMKHPCTVNKKYRRDAGMDFCLEYYTLDMMRNEMAGANKMLKDWFGITPKSFAYPCGETYVGKGAEVKSYMPLVGENFLVGRGWLGESANSPAYLDLQLVRAVKMDTLNFSQMKEWAEEAAAEGGWLIFTGHEIKPSCGKEPFCTTVSELDTFGKYISDPQNGYWVDTIGSVAQYIKDQRNN